MKYDKFSEKRTTDVETSGGVCLCSARVMLVYNNKIRPTNDCHCKIVTANYFVELRAGIEGSTRNTK